jgi:acyl-CoA dehydrogenase
LETIEKHLTDEQKILLSTIRALTKKYGVEYWRNLSKNEQYPSRFVEEIESLGLASIPVPKEYGGPGLGIKEACIVLEEINSSGGNSQPFHGQYYLSFVISKFASDSLKEKYLPEIAKGKLRIQSFALTEPEAGSESTRIKTFARKKSIGGNKDRYEINGHKVFISRVKQSDLMVLVARTKSYEEVEKKVDGITLFLVDLREAKGIEIREIKTMFNSQTYEIFIDGLEVPSENVIGEVNNGFRYLLRVLNPERILIASECIGDAKWFLEKSVAYAKERIVFGREIGANQGIQFPIASVYAKMLAADSVAWEAASMHDQGGDEKTLGKYANIAKYLASECSTEAANVAMDVYGGYGMTLDMDVERKMRENRLYRVAPVSQNLVLSYVAHNVLGLPRSY